MGAFYPDILVEALSVLLRLFGSLLVLYFLNLLALRVEVRLDGSLPYFVHGRIVFVVFNVVRYCFVEQSRLLTHHTVRASQMVQIVVLYIYAVD